MTTKTKRRLLFVDDEPQVLRMLQLALRGSADDWEMAFVGSGVQALEFLASNPVDVVITDMRMPGMSGAQLLHEIVRRYPRTVRIVLSGFADQDQVLKCVGTAHQYMAKPFDLETLREVLRRIAALDSRLASPELRSLLAGIGSLPSVPEIYLQMLEALESHATSVDSITKLVVQDPALTAKMLQLVNSAFFGYARSISSVEEAVQLLGVGVIRSLTLAIHLFHSFDASSFHDMAIDRVWNHSVRTASFARRIAHWEGADEQSMEQSFTAGMLHDLGKLVLASCLSDSYRSVLKRAREEQRLLYVVEQEQFHASHAEVGAYLIGLWGLPVSIVEAVALHHTPLQAAQMNFAPLTAVHCADALSYELGDGELGMEQPGVDAEYVKQLGLADRVAEWRQELSN